MTDKNTTTALDRLFATMQDDQGFPALSSTISEINRIVGSESESASKLTKAILQDFALTNKLLRLVNTVSYGQFGGKINTISKAVVILGFETVRSVAMTLILLEFLENRSQASRLHEEVLSSFFAGLVARQLSQGRSILDVEEAMICAMFQKLGKMLATFYFFDESQKITQLITEGASEAQASHQVLGTSFNDLGIGVARRWGFPDRLLAGMRKITGDIVKKPRDELDHLTVTANLANELGEVAACTPVEDKQQVLGNLTERYREAANVSAQLLDKALEQGLEEFHLRAAALSLPTHNSPLLQAIGQWSGHVAEPEPEPESGLNGIANIDQMVEQGYEEEESGKIDPETILGAGIQDVTNTLVSEFNLSDILQMILETMFRGMRFNRTIAFVRDAATDTMRARIGFGEGIDSLLSRLHFPARFEPDVFHVALEKGVDIVIEDVHAENIASKIPAWYHDAVKAECFLLLPILLNNKAIGMIYADMQHANSLQVTPRQLGLLRTLRNQAVLAIKQKQSS